MDLTDFAAEIGPRGAGPVTIAGSATRGGAVDGVRRVSPPAGITLIDAEEMVVSCGAGTAVAEVQQALAAVGQYVALPAGGSVGGALAVGRSGIRRLGDGPIRESLLMARFVGADGQVIKAGGPTVKNVSGFDLCKLLVGSLGTLGFLGEVRLRTRPLAAASQWFITSTDPWLTLSQVYRPASLLWNGETTWVLLEGHPDDVREQAQRLSLTEVAGPPELPSVSRRSATPEQLRALRGSTGFVAEVGVGVVHHSEPWQRPALQPAVRRLNERLKQQFDATGRLNPGRCTFDV